ncbi:cortical protein marker for cell polarity-domain-containing protein [Gongronella butleri]|nr:cortical protein marker for cell polarity-domain-containing protein [Gongronella butleri]
MIRLDRWLVFLGASTTTMTLAMSLSAPVLDSAQVGQFGLAGQFAGVSPVFDSWQTANTTGGAAVFGDTLSPYLLSLLQGQGNIFDACILDQQLYLGGQFASLASPSPAAATPVTVNNIARLDLASNTLFALDQGVDGPVYALHCDSANRTVYVGGQFHQPVGVANSTQYAGSVAQWYNNQWLPLPWVGFNGPVHTIKPNTQRQTILFGGQFDATGDGVYFNANSSQPVNLGAPTEVSGGNSAFDGKNSDPSSIVCQGANGSAAPTPWLLQDDVPGYWQATFAYAIQPSMFRLSNTGLPDQATRSFSILALGSNDVFTLSYIDPATHATTTCSDMCFLANNASIPYQDFTVQTPINTTGIRIDISSWYGSGGGLGDVQVFQSDNTLYPENTNNNCSGPATSSVVGNWRPVFAYGSYETFLATSIPTADLPSSNVSVTYTPRIPTQGHYTVYAITPGCVGTSTCDQRTQVQLTIEMTPGNTSQITIDQTNAQDATTVIYDGLVVPSSSSFQPKIVLKPAPNATPPSTTNTTIIAEALDFVRNGTNATLVSILEFSPQNYSSHQPIAWLPLPEQLPPGSTVHAIDASQGNTLYIGGQFTGAPYRNLVAFSYASQHMVPLTSNGVDNNVTSLILSGNELYIGGLFNSTIDQLHTGLNHLAVYDTQRGVWSNMGNGTDGPVSDLVAVDNGTLWVSGAFSHVRMGQPMTAPGNFPWQLGMRAWADPQVFLSGTVVANQVNHWIGSLLAAQTYFSVNAITASTWQAPWTRYPFLFDNDDTAIVSCGAFWHNATSNQVVTILGGQFTMQNGAIANLALYHDNQWTGWQLNGGTNQGAAAVNALVQQDGILYVGGAFSGQVQQQPVKSFFAIQLATMTVTPAPGLSDASGNPGRVQAMVISPDKSKLYVGGAFAKAGSLDCRGVCVLDVQQRQWNPVGTGLDGTVTGLTVDGSSLTAIGALQVQGQASTYAQLANPPSSGAWTVPSSSSSSSINLQQLTMTAVFAGENGDTLLAGVSSDHQTVLGTLTSNHDFNVLSSSMSPASTSSSSSSSSSASSSSLLSGSVIRQLLFAPIAQSSADQTRYPANSNSMLMAVGQLQLSQAGNVSVALYDGHGWSPYTLSSQFNGQPGIIQSFFTELECCTASSIRHYLPVPAVILISIGISLGLIFVLVGAGLGWLFVRRKRQGLDYPEPATSWSPAAAAAAAYASGESPPAHDPVTTSTIAQLLDAAQLATLGSATGAAIASASSSSSPHATAASADPAMRDLQVGDHPSSH